MIAFCTVNSEQIRQNPRFICQAFHLNLPKVSSGWLGGSLIEGRVVERHGLLADNIVNKKTKNHSTRRQLEPWADHHPQANCRALAQRRTGSPQRHGLPGMDTARRRQQV